MKTLVLPVPIYQVDPVKDVERMKLETKMLLFIFFSALFCVDITKIASEYIQLLSSKPLPMKEIDSLETDTMRKNMTEDVITSMMEIYKNFDHIIYSKILNESIYSSHHEVVETAVRWKYEVYGKEFQFNIIFTTSFTSDTNLIAGFYSRYNWTAPSYANTSLFEEISVKVGPLSLPGVITVPKFLPKPYGVANLIAGSGWSDLDESVLGDKPFKDLAWGLASKGIAVLRYPKRYHLYKPKEKNYTYEEEYMIDCEAAVDLLYDTFGGQIPVTAISHSEGGKVVSLLVSRKLDKMNGFVSLAGEVEDLIHAYARQQVYVANVTGVPLTPEQQKEVDECWKIYHLLEEHKLPLDYPIPSDLSVYSPNYFITLHDLDNVGIANNLTRVKFLVTNGDHDYQVTLKENFNVWKERNTNPNGSFQVFRGLTHLLFLEEGVPNPIDYFTPQHVFEEVIDDVVEFIKDL